jgi:hypothetical protein
MVAANVIAFAASQSSQHDRALELVAHIESSSLAITLCTTALIEKGWLLTTCGPTATIDEAMARTLHPHPNLYHTDDAFHSAPASFGEYSLFGWVLLSLETMVNVIFSRHQNAMRIRGSTAALEALRCSAKSVGLAILRKRFQHSDASNLRMFKTRAFGKRV